MNNDVNNNNIRGIIFDYGGTIDTDSIHWAEVIWRAYQQCGAKVAENDFRMAYVHGERSLAKFPLIKPEDDFLQLLRMKINIQTSFLVDAHLWTELENDEKGRTKITEDIAQWCYHFVLNNLSISRPVIEKLSNDFPLVLVSNFYGNIKSILNDFNLNYFNDVIESAVVGVRKPDPEIFRMGVNALGIQPQQTIVVGDSFYKDIVPASQIGCKTVWIKGVEWEKNKRNDESLPTIVIPSITQLIEAVNKINSQLI